MSRKHNCPKRGRRSKSRYRDRLTKRGLRAAPQMEDLKTLETRQNRRVRPWADDSEARELTMAEVFGKQEGTSR
jgi:hypothetical protein